MLLDVLKKENDSWKCIKVCLVNKMTMDLFTTEYHLTSFSYSSKDG